MITVSFINMHLGMKFQQKHKNLCTLNILLSSTF